jgi:phospholipase/carboxylesterase
VQTATDTELINFEGWTLRARPAQQPERLLLLIHGLTGDENSMWVFARDLPSHYWMIAPRAPQPAEEGGYTWRPLSSPDSPPASGLRFGLPSLDQLRPSAEALIRLVDAYQSSAGIEASEFDVMGFSQGAVMCNTLAFLYPRRIRKVGILAGFVPDGLEALVPQRPLEGKSFFVTHGTKDETVAIEHARASITLLEQAGAQVTYCEDHVGHKVGASCLSALKKFFAD